MDVAGVDIFRINLSHTEIEDFEFVYDALRSWTDKPVCPDTEGQQGRTHRGLLCTSPKDMKIFKDINRLRAPMVFLSFCSWGEDVGQIKEYFDYDVKIVSKIENKIGLRNLKEICDVSDGILVDREDLSKDVSLVRIPYAQDYIVRKAREYDTPVYIATNLMESMLYEPTPTRAEVNDIIKTLDVGADGLVLAGETAIGKHPIETVKIMKRIMTEFGENPEDDESLLKWLIKE
jgi:pyruvate kinase